MSEGLLRGDVSARVLLTINRRADHQTKRVLHRAGPATPRVPTSHKTENDRDAEGAGSRRDALRGQRQNLVWRFSGGRIAEPQVEPPLIARCRLTWWG